MEKWRLLHSNFNDPYLNMAIEEAILIAVDEGKSPSTLRFWRNSRSVILGRSQNIIDEVNIEECERHRVKVVRRFTGGGAVYQDLGNLNWTFIISRDSELYPNAFSELYEFACNIVIGGLKDLGVNAEFIRPNSIFVKNKKISGLAAYIKRKAVLCHGTLLVHANLRILSKVLFKLRYEVTNIRDELENNSPVSMSAIKDAILHNFERRYKIEVKPGSLNTYEISLSKSLYEWKYRRDSWNFKGQYHSF
ncbi:MAG: lipoate--protein ligase family protein [Candidatus Bathyarchaeia archaeon]|nr:lipoate--protein ligase family protein [Candidatus Bathyarchaeota archaeon]